MDIQAPKGILDILPDQIPLWRRVEQAVYDIFPRYGYQEIRTPVLEYTKLFQRATGETTDIVEKQMYVFDAEKEEDSLSLRPEVTPSVVRACLEHHLLHQRRFQKFFYLAPVFRRERPQKGRLRQFHQIGVEAIGSYDPWVDVETIALFAHLLAALEIAPYEIRLNSIGCRKCREEFRAALKNRIAPDIKKHCANCRARLERNPLRILDCKVEQCVELAEKLPRTVDFLCADCKEHFALVQQGLVEENTPFTLAPKLVRGLDYYTKTVYEVTSSALGAQDALCGGGRYDYLVQELGGPEMGAVGFATGIERLLLVLKTQQKEVDEHLVLDYYLVTIGAENRAKVFRLLNDLRRQGLKGDMDYEGKSVKAQMREANKLGVRFTLMLGKDELEKDAVKVKNMTNGNEEYLALDKVYHYLQGGKT